jgi:transcriptional regulator with XRE-family HTH domain
MSREKTDMCTNSPTAKLLADAIEASPLTQREIAMRAGFPNPNVLSMMKQGQSKVPLERIPVLAKALGVDQYTLLFVAMEEYHPEVWAILEAVFGLPLSEDELKILEVFRRVDLRGEMVVDDVLCAAVEGVLELERDRQEPSA